MPEVDSQDLIKTRVTSIDALRGLAMLSITGGSALFRHLPRSFENPVIAYIGKQFTHVEWLGFHWTDLVMPLFLFVVGVAMPYSLGKRIARGDSKKQLYFHIVKRSVMLFLMGLVYDGILRLDWATMRLAGVLQRIGVCYFFAALLMIHTRWRTQAIVVVAILVSYWAALTLIPVPGYGAGVITREGCLAAYVDQLLLPGKFSEQYYEYGSSNGILPTFSSISTVIFGGLAGHWLRSKRSGNQKTIGLAAAGVVSLVAGYVWGMSLPVVRLIWTSSMVLFAGGWSLLMLAFLYWVIDVKGYKRWSFFLVVIGMNAITIYFTRSFVNFNRIASFFVKGAAGYAGAFETLILDVSTLVVQWLFLFFLYRRRIFLRV